MTAQKGLGIFTLSMLVTGAVDSIRNLPSTALSGPSLVLFFLFAAALFLVPCALVSAELAAHSGENSGLYHWTRRCLGNHTGFLAIWLQWLANLVWFPTILSFIAGSAAWMISPSLAGHTAWMIGTMLLVFWAITLLNLKGIQVSARFASFCTFTGLIIPIAVIMLLALAWILSGHPLQARFTWETMLPDFSNSQNLVSLTAIMTSFVGVELAAVHARDIQNPQKTFPLALLVSVILILVTMIAGSLAIVIVVPANQISLVSGVLQAYRDFLSVWHLSWLEPVMTLMILVGSTGSIISWVISPARGLLQAGQTDGYLPAVLTRINRHGVAQNLLLCQAVLVSLFCTVFFLIPSINGSYWFLTALSTQMYMVMYFLLFLTGIVSHFRIPKRDTGFRIPGGKTGMWIVCVLGMTSCFFTGYIGFMPPEKIDIGSALHYEILFVTGLTLVMLSVVPFWLYQSRKQK